MLCNLQQLILKRVLRDNKITELKLKNKKVNFKIIRNYNRKTVFVLVAFYLN